MGAAIDPVCGMEVEEETAADTSMYRGRMYYFCATGCKVAFDQDPERYVELLAPSGSQTAQALHQANSSTAIREPAGPASAEPAVAIAMPVDVAIKTRRSVARVRPDPVPRRAIERMLDAAVWAPNHHLTEPWEFFVLTGESRRRFAAIRSAFRRGLFKNPDAPEAQRATDKIYADTLATPVIVIVTTTNPTDPDLRDDDYAATMCAIQNMMLVATGLGLGAYLRTGQLIRFAPLLDFLDVPEGRRIAGVMYVGYPALIPERRRTSYEAKTRWLDA